MIENIKDLEKLLKLCRKQGVSEIKWGNVEFKLGEVHEKTDVLTEDAIETDPYAGFPDGELTNEELTFFANGGRPEDNPYRNEQ